MDGPKGNTDKYRKNWERIFKRNSDKKKEVRENIEKCTTLECGYYNPPEAEYCQNCGLKMSLKHLDRERDNL